MRTVRRAGGRGRRARAGARDERGISQSVQLAMITPVLLLTILGIIQAGLWLHASTIVTRAAQAGADSARSLQGGDVQAREVATRIARGNGLDGIDVHVVRGADRVQVAVAADAPLVLVPLRVETTASAPRERVSRP